MNFSSNQIGLTQATVYDISLADLAGANSGQRPDLLAKTQAIYRTPDGKLYAANATRSQLVAASTPATVETNQLTGVSAILAEGKAFYLLDRGSVEQDRAEDKQREFYEAIKFPAIYFDPSIASDTGDGSVGRPYRDLTAARLMAGRRHLIKAGTTTTLTGGATWLTIPATGTSDAPIILGRYGDTNLANPILDGSAVNRIIRGGTGAKFWRVRDIEMIGPKTGANRYIVSQNSLAADADAIIKHEIILARLKLRDVGTDGATDCNGVKLYGADNLILDCEIYDIADDAVWFHGNRTRVTGNTIYRVGQSGRIAGDCIQCGAKSDGAIVRGNLLDHFERDYKQCIYFEQTVSISNDVLIEDNYCVSADGTAGDAGPIVCGATNSIVRRNFCKGGIVGIALGTGSVAHNNVVVSTVGRGIDCGQNTQAHFNTIIQTGSDTTQSLSVGIRTQTGTTGVKAYNNILIGQYNGIASGAEPIDERNNAFAIRGVSDAKVRVNGAVVAPVNPIIGAYASWGTSLGLDVNMRPVVVTALRDSVFPVAVSDSKDKDQLVRAQVVGAYF